MGGPFMGLTGIYNVNAQGIVQLGDLGPLKIGGINAERAAEIIYRAAYKGGDLRRVKLDLDVEQHLGQVSSEAAPSAPPDEPSR